MAEYALPTRKTTLEVNEALFHCAREVLGTRGLKETVQRAFEEVLATDARRQAIRQLKEMDGSTSIAPRSWQARGGKTPLHCR